MCIRDRVYIEPQRHYREVYPDWSNFQSRVFLSPIEYDGCLLYTSDAADERSSVDLGGRRIIKKKKNRELCMGG